LFLKRLGSSKEAQQAIFEEALNALMQDLGEARETLRAILKDAEAPASTRVRAAQIILEQAIALHKSQDRGPGAKNRGEIMSTLSALSRRVKKLIGQVGEPPSEEAFNLFAGWNWTIFTDAEQVQLHALLGSLEHATTDLQPGQGPPEPSNNRAHHGRMDNLAKTRVFLSRLSKGRTGGTLRMGTHE
jgi:hypothetical protein